MVERLLCKQDVNGSSPLISICERQRQEETIQQLLKTACWICESKSRKHLENCIYTKRSQVETSEMKEARDRKKSKATGVERRQSKKANKFVVKLQRAHGGYLGIQRR